MELFQKILLPLDGSPKAERAIPTTIKLAKNLGSEVILLRVLEIPMPSIENPPAVMQQWIDDTTRLAEEEAATYLAELAERFRAYDIPVETVIRGKVPYEDILDVAREYDVDVIIMSPHGRGYQDEGIDCWTFGSVADKIVRRSPCPVLLVRGEARNVPAL